MKTGVLILNYNNPSDTINCIESVLRYNTADIKFVIVDNASPNIDGVTLIDSWLSERFHGEYENKSEADSSSRLMHATFIVAANNEGYAKGNNIGLKFIFKDPELDNVLILNNDILFTSDIIPHLVSKLYKLPNAAVVSPLLLKKDGIEIDYNCARKDINVFELGMDFLTLKKRLFSFQQKAKDNKLVLKYNPNLLSQDFLEIELPSGSCMLLKTEFFKEINGFDPNTFLYYEENILHSKILSRNKKTYLIPGLSCIHLGGSTISKHKRQYLFDKKCDRSAWIYINNYANVSQLNKLFFNFCYSFYNLNRAIIHKVKTIFA